MIKILLDTDVGNDMDDMQALSYLLSRDDAELVGITTVTGEPILRAVLADIICKLANKDIPIHPGAAEPIEGTYRQRSVSYTQKDLPEKFPHRESFPENTAIEFMRETIEKYAGEILLCAIGPLTNVAMLFTKYPHVIPLIKALVIMGGRFNDNIDTARWGIQEWNIINDPGAARIVFDAPVKDVRVFGVEFTHLARKANIQKLADASEKCPMLRPFSMAIRTNTEAWYHDAIAVSALSCEDGMSFKKGNIKVSEAGDTVFTENENGNHTLMTEFDVNKFFDHFFSTLGIDNAEF